MRLSTILEIYITEAIEHTNDNPEGWGMSLNYGDWNGSLYFVNAFDEYWQFRYTEFGTGYSYISADIEFETGHKKETYDVDFPGPVFYVTANF